MSRSRVVSILTVIVVLLLGTVTAQAEKVIEQYRGFAVAMGTVATGARSTVDIGLYRYTTDEERNNFVKILSEQGQGALNKAMFDAPQVAFLKIGNSMGYKLRVAREVKDEAGKRHLFFVSDRPVTFGGAQTPTRSDDYMFSFIELVLDENGKGEGQLALGVALGWDTQKDTLALKTYSSEPVRIMSVSKVK